MKLGHQVRHLDELDAQRFKETGAKVFGFLKERKLYSDYQEILEGIRKYNRKRQREIETLKTTIKKLEKIEKVITEG